ncbi:MAG: ribbon-helix-helix domain-containing protein, partial [Fimbriimonadaceae bacterium]|nr:ribbon-helix-helix domain-containing protein [Fimbriimonadaceae bacterium]
MQTRERFELRLPESLMAQVREAAEERGFANVTAFIRAALQNELRSGETALDRTERAVASSIDRVSRDVQTLHTTQQAVFALTDSLARLFLTCVPEPQPEVLDQAKRKARLRYSRFLKSVAQNMTGDSRA